MDSGQLFIMQMPATAATSAAMPGTTPMSAEQPGGIDFAALLQAANPVASVNGMIMTATGGETAAAQALEKELSTAPLQAVVIPDLVEVKPEAIVFASGLPMQAAENVIEGKKEEEPAARMPQEVALESAGAQLAQLFQLSGRMPELQLSPEQQAPESYSQPVAMTIAQQPAQTAPAITSLTGAGTVVAETTATTKLATAEQPDNMIFRSPEKEAPNPVAADVENSAGAAGNVKTKAGFPAILPAEVKVEAANPDQGSKVLFVAKQEQTTVSSGPEQSESSDWSGTSTQAAARVTTMPQQAPVRQVMEAYAQPVAAKPVPATEDAPIMTPEAAPRVSRAVETGAVPVHLAAKEHEPQIREERILQQTASDTSGKVAAGSQNLLSAAVKEPSSLAQDDTPNGENQLFDAKLAGQIHHAAAQKTGNTTVPATAGTTAADSAQPAASAEHVVKQVGERIAAHEVKSGSDQIVLRLTPENLGELKVNLRMENQRLTVEIVTDNKTVTEALRQNSDSLKETLARQNIKMDSFDVSTGSNGQDSLAGRNNRNMGEWQDMARHRQSAQWLQGGYSVPAVAAADNVAVQQASYRRHGLVDVHY